MIFLKIYFKRKNTECLSLVYVVAVVFDFRKIKKEVRNEISTKPGGDIP